MAFKLATWNVEGRLSDYAHGKRGSAEHILDGIAAINADVLVLPEAYLGDQPAEGINDRLQAMGYEWRDVRYGDQDRDWSQEFMASMPSLRVLSRLAIINSEHVQWGNLRNLLVLTVRDPDTEKDVRIIATHLDDRTSEHRKRQIEDAIPFINASELPTIMAGDWNEMHAKSFAARVIGSWPVRMLARYMPSKYSLAEGVYADDLRGVFLRGTEMAKGEAIAMIEARTDLRDLDPTWQPTTTLKLRSLPWVPSVRIAQIDRAAATPNVKADRVRVWPDGGSDHRAASMEIIEIK